MADPKAIGQQFLTAFYQTFDQNRAALGSLYVRGSAMEYVQVCMHTCCPPITIPTGS